MGAPDKKVVWFPNENPTVTGEDISNDIIELIVKRSKNIKTNQFMFKLRNTKRNVEGSLFGRYIDTETGKIRLLQDDRVNISIKRSTDGSAIDENDFVMTGVIQKAEYQLEEGGYVLNVSGVDNSYIMLNKVWPKNYASAEIPTIVQDVVQQLSFPSDGSVDPSDPTTFAIDAQLSGSSLPDDVNKKYIVSVRKATNEDGTVNTDTTFPSRDITNFQKPGYIYLDMLSSPEFTNTDAELAGTEPIVYSRQFIWWIDEQNRFHWFYPDEVIDATLTIGTDPEIRSYKLNQTTFEAFNMVIWNAGSDGSGGALQGYVFNDNTSLSELKMKFIPFNEVGNERRDRDGLTGAALIAAVKTDVQAKVKKLFAQTAKNQLKGSITVYGARYDIGDKVTFIDRQNGINVDVRVTDVTYNLSAKSLVTVLAVEEDEPKLISILTG